MPSPSQPKLQRWTDLLAALLRRKFPADFESLRAEVPAYSDSNRTRDALMRMFERDKDELRALGVPIESVADEENNLSQYRLASRQFYLPYLQLRAEAARPLRRPRGPGYQSLPILACEPDELEAIARAAHRVRAVGDPALAHEAMSAIRKLGHDIPLPRVAAAEELLALDALPDPDVLDRLGDALRRRKQVRFTYHAMHSDRENERTVDPYGLAFLSGHWYLVGRDHAADALRQYRVNRVRTLTVNAQRTQSADYTVPASFDLAAHTRSRQAWELGDSEPVEVTVRFTVHNGITEAARHLGEPVPEDPMLRRFSVRRVDTFALWMLGFAGDAVVLSPPEVVETLRGQARETLARYEVAR